jgi:hypothetical protein
LDASALPTARQQQLSRQTALTEAEEGLGRCRPCKKRTRTYLGELGELLEVCRQRLGWLQIIIHVWLPGALLPGPDRQAGLAMPLHDTDTVVRLIGCCRTIWSGWARPSVGQ